MQSVDELVGFDFLIFVVNSCAILCFLCVYLNYSSQDKYMRGESAHGCDQPIFLHFFFSIFFSTNDHSHL